MRLLLDQGLPRSTVLYLHNKEMEAVHVGDRGLATASDSKILDFSREEAWSLSRWMPISKRYWHCPELRSHL